MLKLLTLFMVSSVLAGAPKRKRRTTTYDEAVSEITKVFLSPPEDLPPVSDSLNCD
jgi:hypothetical protein